MGDFIMNELNATNNDCAKAQSIQKQYISREDNKLEQLKRLDSRVKAPGKVVASLLGVVGALTMGAGMSFVMVWENMMTGLILGIPGVAVLLLAYPVYKLIIGSRKKKFAAEVIKLSNDLMKN